MIWWIHFEELKISAEYCEIPDGRREYSRGDTFLKALHSRQNRRRAYARSAARYSRCVFEIIYGIIECSVRQPRAAAARHGAAFAAAMPLRMPCCVRTISIYKALIIYMLARQRFSRAAWLRILARRIGSNEALGFWLAQESRHGRTALGGAAGVTRRYVTCAKRQCMLIV